MAPECRGKILLVDDCRLFATSLSVLLRKYGYETRTFESSSEAFSSSVSSPADVVLSEVNMPEMGGRSPSCEGRTEPQHFDPQVLQAFIENDHIFDGFFISYRHRQ